MSSFPYIYSYRSTLACINLSVSTRKIFQSSCSPSTLHSVLSRATMPSTKASFPSCIRLYGNKLTITSLNLFLSISALLSTCPIIYASAIRSDSIPSYPMDSSILNLMFTSTKTHLTCLNNRGFLCKNYLRTTDVIACRHFFRYGKSPKQSPFGISTSPANYDTLAREHARPNVDLLRCAGFLSVLLSSSRCNADVSRTGLFTAGLADAARRILASHQGRVSVAHDMKDGGRAVVLWCDMPPCPDEKHDNGEEDELEDKNRIAVTPRVSRRRKLLASADQNVATRFSFKKVVESWRKVVRNYKQCRASSARVRSCTGGWMMTADC